MLYDIKVDLDLKISGFVPESCQTTTTHRVTEIHFGNDYIFFFSIKEKITQHFNGIEENIYFKQKDNVYEKEFIELFSLCI